MPEQWYSNNCSSFVTIDTACSTKGSWNKHNVARQLTWYNYFATLGQINWTMQFEWQPDTFELQHQADLPAKCKEKH